MPKKVRFHDSAGRASVEPFHRFAAANGTDARGAVAILAFWESKRWISRRSDGGYDVHRKVARRDPETVAMLRRGGFPVIEFAAVS